MLGFLKIILRIGAANVVYFILDYRIEGKIVLKDDNFCYD